MIMQRGKNSGMKTYYPLGCTDPDYALIKFTAIRGNSYHGLNKIDFDICDAGKELNNG
jgi:general stress protein 26